MEKKYRDIPTTEIGVAPTKVSCRPETPAVLTLRTDSPDVVRIELGLPLDVKAESAALLL